MRLLLSIFTLSLTLSPLHAAGEREESGDGAKTIHVYSHRHYDTDDQLYELFESRTGYDVQVVEADADELLQRLISEGDRSPADLLITVDAERLYQAKEAELLQAVHVPVVETLLPENLRDPDGYWYALTLRSRVIAFDKTRSNGRELSTYEALATPDFAGRVAVRSSANIYNVSLLAGMISHLGEDRAREWARGMTRSFARPPQGNDRDQLRAVVNGEADYAIVNTYYVARMVSSTDEADRSVGERIGVFFPNQNGTGAPRGAHINISGAAVPKHADNRDGAVELIAFLLSDEAQELYAQANYEYPVRESIKLAPEVEQWGNFERDTLDLSELGRHARRATMIFDEVGWR